MFSAAPYVNPNLKKIRENIPEHCLEKKMEQLKRHVVIIGAGFAGIYAARNLARMNKNFRITLVDRHNYHLFQPLLYQVAMGHLSPESIAYPIRSIFSGYKNVSVIKGNVQSIEPDGKTVRLRNQTLHYDELIIATGVRPNYFGHDAWERYAPGIKTIQDALYMRMRIYNIFEMAERNKSLGDEAPPLNFVVIGGGPAGVELSGALAELSRRVLKKDFRHIRPDKARIYLVEALDHILGGFPTELERSALKSLARLGVEVKTGHRVIDVRGDRVLLQSSDGTKEIESQAVLWTAGVQASYARELFRQADQPEMDRMGRIKVKPDLSVPGYENVFVAGDLAVVYGEDGRPLPGVASVAIQEGTYVARAISERIRGRRVRPFRFFSKGRMAVIGRNAAVVELGPLKLSGFPAWLIWVFIHIAYLISFQNKFTVMLSWAWYYFRQKVSARIVFGCEDKDLNHPVPKCPE